MMPPAVPYTLDLVYASQAAWYDWATWNLMTGQPQTISAVIGSLNVFVPGASVTGVDANGSVVFAPQALVNGYTVATAPIVYENNNAGYMPGLASDVVRGMGDHTGSPGRDMANAPASIDLKAGIRYQRANKALVPGSTDKIVSVGGSGAGAMSSRVGATGNLPDYFPALPPSGAAGITARHGTYASTIADIDNADLAHAWNRFDSSVNRSGPRGYPFKAYQKGREQSLASRTVHGTVFESSPRRCGHRRVRTPEVSPTLGRNRPAPCPPGLSGPGGPPDLSGPAPDPPYPHPGGRWSNPKRSRL